MFCHLCHSTDWSWSHSKNSHCTAQEPQPRKAKQHPRPSNPPQTPPFKDGHLPWFFFRFFIRFRQWLWSFKLLEPSPSSDEHRGHFSNHYTIGLVSHCPTVTVHAGKRFKVLTDSGAALSLAHTSIYHIWLKTAKIPKYYLQQYT